MNTKRGQIIGEGVPSPLQSARRVMALRAEIADASTQAFDAAKSLSDELLFSAAEGYIEEPVLKGDAASDLRKVIVVLREAASMLVPLVYDPEKAADYRALRNMSKADADLDNLCPECGGLYSLRNVDETSDGCTCDPR